MVGLRKLKWVLPSVVNYIFLMVFHLGTLLFNIDSCDLFFVNIITDIANYADDTNPYECDQHCDNLISNMEKNFNWFEFNNLKANASKCHFFLSLY